MVSSGPNVVDGARVQWAILVLLGVVLAWSGVTRGVDSIVWYVFAIVDTIGDDPWSILQPVYNPPPMYTHAYRPLSTAGVKLLSGMFGRDLDGLRWMTFVHGLGLVGYGLAARHCLIVHGFGPRLSTVAAATSMAMPTVLFSAWTIPEFDMVGGAIILLAAAALHNGRSRLAVVCMALAILTKETTAIIMWGWLLARAVVAWPTGNRKPLRTAVLYLGALIVAVWPILTVEPPVTHAYSVADGDFEWSRVAFLAFHNLSQVFYVLGPSGALLLFVLALVRVRPGAAFPSLFTGVLALLVLSPITRLYNHYESVIFADWPWVLGWMGLASVALCILMWRGVREERVLTLALGAAFAGLLLGPVLASFSRADLSARLYAPVIPILHALAFRGARLVTPMVAYQGGSGPLTRALAVAAAAGIVWHSAAGAISAVQFTHARFPLELDAKIELISTLGTDADAGDPCPWVYYTNRDQELAIEELALLGDVSDQQTECTRLIQLSATSTENVDFFAQTVRLHGYDHHREEEHSLAVESALQAGEPMPVSTHLYVQLARSEMGADANAYLQADFEWATERMPETDVGYFEQAVGMTLVTHTPLERLFNRAAHDRAPRSTSFIQLPLWLFEVPQRLVLGVPLIERWRYTATRYSIPKASRPKRGAR